MIEFQIRQEPGPRARRSAGRYGFAHFKRLATLEASCPREALRLFVQNRYARPGANKQYVEHRFEWQSESALGDRWNRDDGQDPRSRRWRAVVTLANGRYVHDIFLQAWRAS